MININNMILKITLFGITKTLSPLFIRPDSILPKTGIPNGKGDL